MNMLGFFVPFYNHLVEWLKTLHFQLVLIEPKIKKAILYVILNIAQCVLAWTCDFGVFAESQNISNF